MSERVSAEAEGWALPERSRPPLLGELVERIDEALATARASEAAIMTVGAAALDAAEQARRAAELAQRASTAMATRAPLPAAMPENGGITHSSTRDQSDLGDFNARADRVAERLQRLSLSA